MTNAARTCVLLMGSLPLLVAGLAGCRHKAPPPPPPVSTAPPLQPSSITQVPAVPPLPEPATPHVGAPGSDQKAAEAAPPPAHHPRRSKKHPVFVADASDPAPAATSQPTVTPAPPAPAPSLGQLSAGAGADSHERAVMSEQIRAQETRLSKLKHPLNDEDEAITQQIRVFLIKARQAVAESDLDGAQTLTTKAKVLLDELSRS